MSIHQQTGDEPGEVTVLYRRIDKIYRWQVRWSSSLLKTVVIGCNYYLDGIPFVTGSMISSRLLGILLTTITDFIRGTETLSSGRGTTSLRALSFDRFPPLRLGRGTTILHPRSKGCHFRTDPLLYLYGTTFYLYFVLLFAGRGPSLRPCQWRRGNKTKGSFRELHTSIKLTWSLSSRILPIRSTVVTPGLYFIVHTVLVSGLPPLPFRS